MKYQDSDAVETEHQRIIAVYEQRKRHRTSINGLFVYEGLHHVLRVQERYRITLRMLKETGIHSLREMQILDVGCGDGNMLRSFLEWGTDPQKLHGIDLRPDVVQRAKEMSPHLDIRQGSALELPWQDQSMDMVCQHTVFTSVLDEGMRHAIAHEMDRVLRPQGLLLWYDFSFNNPQNPAVRAIRKHDFKALFPLYVGQIRRITLAPPIARRLPNSLLPTLYPVLASFPMLCTHWLMLMHKPLKA